jgi:hypothetical protein
MSLATQMSITTQMSIKTRSWWKIIAHRGIFQKFGVLCSLSDSGAGRRGAFFEGWNSFIFDKNGAKDKYRKIDRTSSPSARTRATRPFSCCRVERKRKTSESEISGEACCHVVSVHPEEAISLGCCCGRLFLHVSVIPRTFFFEPSLHAFPCWFEPEGTCQGAQLFGPSPVLQ